MSTPYDNTNSSITAVSVRKDTSYLQAEKKGAFPSLQRLLWAYSCQLSAFFYSISTSGKSTVNKEIDNMLDTTFHSA